MEHMSAEKYKKYLEKQQSSGYKYHNKTEWYDGLYFESQKELKDYIDQKRLLMAGEIAGFLWQGMLIVTTGTDKNNKAVTYRPDIVVFNNDGTYEIREDKGKRTQVYINKLKIIKNKYPHIRFKEI